MKKWKKTHRQHKRRKKISWTVKLEDDTALRLREYCYKHGLSTQQGFIKILRQFAKQNKHLLTK